MTQDGSSFTQGGGGNGGIVSDGGFLDLDSSMTDLKDLGENLLGGSSAMAKPDPISGAMGNLNRPYFAPNQSVQPQQTPALESQTYHIPQQSGGNPQSQAPSSSSDIKVIELDPNYRIVEDDPFSSQPQPLQQPPQQPPQQQFQPQPSIQPMQSGGMQQQQQFRQPMQQQQQQRQPVIQNEIFL
jgi:hypothetical protein